MVIDPKGDFADLPSRLGRDHWDHYSVHSDFRLGLQPPGDLVPSGLWAMQIAKSITAISGLIMAVSPFAGIIGSFVNVMRQSQHEKPAWPSLHQVRDIAKRFVNDIGGKQDYLRSLRTALDYLLDNSVNLFHASRGWDAWEQIVVPRRSAVIDTTLLDPKACAVVTEIIAAQLLLPRLYNRLMNAPPVLLVVDEADSLCSQRIGEAYPEGYSCLGQVLKQGRAFNITACLSVSVLGEVSQFIRNNISYHFTFAQPDFKSLGEAAKTLLIPPAGIGLLASLPVGVCVYKEGQGPCPFSMVARIDEMPTSDMRRPDCFDKHPFMPDVPLFELPQVVEAFRRERGRENSEQRDDARGAQAAQSELPDMARKLLDMASLHPFVSVGRLWDKLGYVAPEAKSKARKRLTKDKLAEFVLARCGSTSRLLMFPTEKGWQLLGKQPPRGLGRGGLVHRHFCHWLRDWHVAQGHDAQLEWLVPGTKHWADVAYTLNGVKHCVEVIVDCMEDNLVSHLKACFLQSDVVASVTIFVAQKAMLKEVQTLAASDASLFPYMNRIHFDVIEPYIPKE